MKIKKKTKSKTNKKLPLEELESRIWDENQFIIDCSHFACSKL